MTSDLEPLQHDERGSGDPVVVIGGGPARHPDYLGDLAGLGDDATLVLPHLRGVGRTPFPDRPEAASFWEQAADVEELRRRLGIERLTLVGHSAGTLLALAFAIRFPASLARLVLLTPPAKDLVDVESDVPAILGRRGGDPDVTAALAAARQGPPDGGDDEALNAWQHRIAPVSYARWETPQRAHSRLGPWSAAGVAAWGSVPPPASFRDDLARVAVPVRVLVAEEDAAVGAAAPLALAEVFPDGRAVTVAGAGHYPWIDAPEAFLRAARSALRD